GGGDRAGQEAHGQHAVGEHVLEAELLGEVEIDMDRVVIARAAAIERQLMAADRRQHDRLQLIAHLHLVELRRCNHGPLPHFLAASGLRTTVMLLALATGLPAWSFISVSDLTNYSAPPFLS